MKICVDCGRAFHGRKTSSKCSECHTIYCKLRSAGIPLPERKFSNTKIITEKRIERITDECAIMAKYAMVKLRHECSLSRGW